MAKLKEYARGRKLNDDAQKGKQAVDMNWFQEGEEGGEQGENEEEGNLNKVSQAKCSFCKKPGHTAAQCWKAKAKGKGKGEGDKGKGKGKDGGGGGGKGKGKSGPKGGCYTCGGDHYESNCPKKGNGDPHQVFTLCSVTEIPLSNRYAQLSTEEQEDTLQMDNLRSSPGSARTEGLAKSCRMRSSVCPAAEAVLEEEPNENEDVPKEEKKDKPPELVDSDDEDQAWNTIVSKGEKKFGSKKAKKRWMRLSTTGSLSACAGGSDHGSAKSLIEMSNETAHAVGEIPEWEELGMMVDSGASVTVINEEMVKAVTATDARPNVKYEVADGSLIENMGQKTVMAVTDTGVTNKMTAQVAEVKKALLSVAKIVQAGNRVVFVNNNN